jgi:outer membrane protein, heavy metal efflux system
MPNCSPPSLKKPMLNRFFTRQPLLWLLLLFPGVAAWSQAAPLDLPGAITQTLAQNPALVALGHQVAVQAGRVQQAGLPANPELSLEVEDALGTGELKGMSSASTQLGISWVLEGAQRRERVKVEEAQSALVDVERDIQRLDAAAQTARLYRHAQAQRARLHLAEEAIETARTLLKVIEQQVAAGHSPAADSARARVELSRRLLERDDLQHQERVTHRQLAAQWGSTQVQFSALAGELTPLPSLASFPSLKSRLAQNPRLHYFATRERWESSQVSLAQAEGEPQWRLSAGIKHLAALDENALVAGISVPLGVFDRQQGKIAQARAALALNRAQGQAQQIDAEAALFAAHQALLHSQHRVKAHETDILPALTTALKETRRAYTLGRYSYLEWQAVQSEYLAAQHSLIDARLTAHLQAIELERLTGMAIAPASNNPPTHTPIP